MCSKAASVSTTQPMVCGSMDFIRPAMRRTIVSSQEGAKAYINFGGPIGARDALSQHDIHAAGLHAIWINFVCQWRQCAAPYRSEALAAKAKLYGFGKCCHFRVIVRKLLFPPCAMACMRRKRRRSLRRTLRYLNVVTGAIEGRDVPNFG